MPKKIEKEKWIELTTSDDADINVADMAALDDVKRAVMSSFESLRLKKEAVDDFKSCPQHEAVPDKDKSSIYINKLYK